jgi:hypothetical protein
MEPLTVYNEQVTGPEQSTPFSRSRRIAESVTDKADKPIRNHIAAHWSNTVI